jgi:hypothetical protein
MDVEALQNGSDGQKFNHVKGVMKDAKERFRDWRRVSSSLRINLRRNLIQVLFLGRRSYFIRC